MTFQPQGQNPQQYNQPPKQRKVSNATVTLMVLGLISLVIGLFWAVFLNEASSTDYVNFFIPYTPVLIGFVLLIIGFKRYNARR